MDGGYIFGAPGLPKTPQELERLRAVAQSLAVRSASNAPKNVGQGLSAIGQALVYRGMMDDAAKAQAAGNASVAADMGGLLSGMGGAGAAAPAAPVAPATPAPPSSPSIPPQALSPNDLSTTPAPMSGGNVAQNSAALTDAVAKLESGGQGADGPAGRYVNERFQQFPAFAKQYGTGADGVTNYAKQVLAANPNATFGDMYGGYVTGTGNPATANVASLQTTTQPGAKGAYGNLVRNSPIDPKTPLSQVMASGLGDLLGPASAYADVPKPGDTLLQQPQPMPQAGPALAFNGAPGNPQPGNPLSAGPAPAAQAPTPPAGMQPFTSPQNLQTLATKPVTLPIGNQPGPQSVAPQAAPQAVSPQAQSSGPTIQALMKIAQNPWLNPGQQAIVKTLLAQKLKTLNPTTSYVPIGDNAILEKNSGKVIPVDVNKKSNEIRDYETYAAQTKAAGQQPVPFFDYQKQLKEAGRPVTTIDQRAPDAFESQYGQGQAKRAEAVIAEGDKASGIYQRNQVLRALNNQIQTGKITPATSTIGAWAKSVGLDPASLGIDPSLPVNAETFNALSNESMMSKLGPGGFPSQNFSDTDRKFLEKTVTNLGDQPGANELKLAISDRISQLQMEKADKWQAISTSVPRNQRADAYEKFERDWRQQMKTRNVFGDLIGKIGGQSPAPAAAGGSAPTAFSPPQNWQFSPSRKQYRDQQGNIYDMNGQPVR